MKASGPEGRLRNILLAFFVIGLAVRFSNLGGKSLWLDEMTSIDVARHSLFRIATGDVFDNYTPPLYYVLLHGWLKVFPANELGLRSFSAIIDSCNILLCFWAFVPLIPGMPALIMSLLYTFAAFPLYFAQEGRMYPLLIFFCLLFHGLILRLPTGHAQSQYGKSFALGLVAALGLYTHYYFAPFAASLGLVLLLLNVRDRLFWKHLITAGVFATLLFAPWLAVMMDLAKTGQQSFRQFVFLVLPYAAFRFSAGYANLPLAVNLKTDVWESITANLPLIALYVAVPAALILLALRSGFREAPRQTLVLAWTFLFPPTIMLLVSLRSPILSERYLAIIFPEYLALLSLGLSPFHERDSGAPVRLLRLTFFAALVFALYQHFGNPNFGFTNFRDAARTIRSAERSDPGSASVVLVQPEHFRPVLRHYLGEESTLVSFPGGESDVPTVLGPKLPETVILVEPASDPSKTPLVSAAGYRPLREQVFPFENGLRLTIFSRQN